MSLVTTQPEALAAAAGTLQGIGSAMRAQNAAVAAPTTGVVPAAADEVSALTAARFGAHARLYQAVSAQAGAIHEMFVNTDASQRDARHGRFYGCYPRVPSHRGATPGMRRLRESGTIRVFWVGGYATA